MCAALFLFVNFCAARLRYCGLMKKQFDSIESVIADLRRGKMVIVVDDADRENEGDLICAAQVVARAINYCRFKR
jgi:hypothetical protein